MLSSLIEKYGACKNYRDSGVASLKRNGKVVSVCKFHTSYASRGSFTFQCFEDRNEKDQILKCEVTIEEEVCYYLETEFSSTARKEVSISAALIRASHQSNLAADLIPRLLLGRKLPEKEQFTNTFRRIEILISDHSTQDEPDGNMNISPFEDTVLKLNSSGLIESATIKRFRDEDEIRKKQSIFQRFAANYSELKNMGVPTIEDLAMVSNAVSSILISSIEFDE